MRQCLHHENCWGLDFLTDQQYLYTALKKKSIFFNPIGNKSTYVMACTNTHIEHLVLLPMFVLIYFGVSLTITKESQGSYSSTKEMKLGHKQQMVQKKNACNVIENLQRSLCCMCWMLMMKFMTEKLKLAFGMWILNPYSMHALIFYLCHSSESYIFKGKYFKGNFNAEYNNIIHDKDNIFGLGRNNVT